jgi:hypothetical protein
VAADHGAEFSTGCTQVCVAPEVAHGDGVLEAQITPAHIHAVGKGGEIVESDVVVAVTCIGNPDGMEATGLLNDGTSGLIDSEELIVGEGRFGEGIELGEVAAELEGRIRHGPDGDGGLLFGLLSPE